MCTLATWETTEVPGGGRASRPTRKTGLAQAKQPQPFSWGKAAGVGDHELCGGRGGAGRCQGGAGAGCDVNAWSGLSTTQAEPELVLAVHGGTCAGKGRAGRDRGGAGAVCDAA